MASARLRVAVGEVEQGGVVEAVWYAWPPCARNGARVSSRLIGGLSSGCAGGRAAQRQTVIIAGSRADR
jgi:hypothetical protein